jgi:hypothetical protein
MTQKTTQEILKEIEEEKQKEDYKQEVKIGFNQLKEMEIKDLIEIENKYNQLQQIKDKGINNNKKVRDNKINKCYAEDLINSLK